MKPHISRSLIIALLLSLNTFAQYTTIHCSSANIIDSISVIDQSSDLSRYIFEYDANNNFTSVLRIRRPIETWLNDIKYNFSYYNNGLTSERIEQHWESGAWLNYNKALYLYNLRGQIIEDTIYGWVNNNWFHSSIYSYTYNDTSAINFGLITSKMLRNWGGSDWVNNFMETYSYDSLGRLSDDIYIMWVNNAWRNETKKHYTYDTLGRKTTFEFYEWNGTSWRNSTRYRYYYNNYGLLSDTYFDQWQSSSGTWIACSVTHTAYNSNQLIIEETRTPLINISLSNFFRMTYQYIDNLISSALYEYKRDTDLTWTPMDRNTFTHNDGRLATNVHEKWSNGAWEPYYSLREIVDPDSNIIPFYSSYFSIKSHTSTGVEKTLASFYQFDLAQNYPNPFNPSTKIQYTLREAGKVKIEVFDITGCRVKELINQHKDAGKYEVDFRAGNLASGVYFYTITIASQNNKPAYTSTKKMLLIK